MDANQIDKAVSTRARVRISKNNGWAAGVEGIALGFRDLYGNLKVGFVDANGNYTGDYTVVSYKSVELITEESMDAKSHGGEQATDKVLAMTSELTDEALCIAWMGTEGNPVTKELAIVRGWIMEDLNRRLGDDLFDEWLMAVDENGDTLNPLAFFKPPSKACR